MNNENEYACPECEAPVDTAGEELIVCDCGRLILASDFGGEVTVAQFFMGHSVN